MKELFRAQQIYSEIQTINEDIKSIKNDINNVIDNDCSVTVRYKLPKKPKENDIINDEGDLIVNYEGKDDDSNGSFFRFLMKPQYIGNENFEEKILTSSEFMIVFGSLLKYKEDLKKRLINEFNNLNTKIKL